jgi:hypothetical protein
MTGDVLADELAEIAELEKPETEAPKAADPALKPQEQPQEPEAEAEEEERDNEGQFVRKGDFKALRQKAEAAERAKQELEARYASDMAKLNERLAIIAQQNAQRDLPKAPEIPDINSDPIGHFQAKQAELERKLQEAESWRKQTQQVTQQQEVLQKIGTEVSRLEQEFAKSTPDYHQAQQHLFASWAQEAQALGASPEEAIRFWSMQIVQRAGQQNKNPAQVAYELAKQRGYLGAQPKPQAPTQTPQGPNLDTIQRGLAASKSTSAAPGKAAPSGTPTIEALLQMDDEEFAKNYGSRDAAKWQSDMEKIMGLR